MPPTKHDLIMGGVEDIVLTPYILTKHAKRRCKERKISLESVQKKDSSIHMVTKGKILVTAWLRDNFDFHTNLECPESKIAYFIGKNGRNMKRLSDFLGIRIEIIETGIKVISDDYEKKKFSCIFLNELIRFLIESKSNNFIFGRIEKKLTKEDKEFIENNSEKITSFDRNNKTYFCSKSLNLVKKLIKKMELGEDNFLLYESNIYNLPEIKCPLWVIIWLFFGEN